MNPEALIERQLAAYNAQDLEAFVACYAEDIELFTFPQEPLLKGKAALRERYGELFRTFPGEQATILHRAVYGNFVADHEQMRIRPSAPTVIYEVLEGLIQRVWLLRA